MSGPIPRISDHEPAGAPACAHRLGGNDAVVAVVDDFVGRAAADSRINAKFARTDVPRLKAMLVEQVCAATGGPVTYTGRGMRETHDGMGVTAGESAYVGDSPEDVRMAQAAGVFAVGIPGAFPNRELLVASAPELLASTLEEAVGALLARFGGGPRT